MAAYMREVYKCEQISPPSQKKGAILVFWMELANTYRYKSNGLVISFVVWGLDTVTCFISSIEIYENASWTQSE